MSEPKDNAIDAEFEDCPIAEAMDEASCPIAEALDEVAATAHDMEAPPEIEAYAREGASQVRKADKKASRFMRGVDTVLDKLAPMFKEPRPVVARYSK